MKFQEIIWKNFKKRMSKTATILQNNLKESQSCAKSSLGKKTSEIKEIKNKTSGGLPKEIFDVTVTRNFRRNSG